MKKVCLAALILLISSSMVLTASSQEQVAWTVYVHEGNLNGTMLSNVQVTDKTQQATAFKDDRPKWSCDSYGQPGTWLCSFTKEGSAPLNLNYNVTRLVKGQSIS